MRKPKIVHEEITETHYKPALKIESKKAEKLSPLWTIIITIGLLIIAFLLITNRWAARATAFEVASPIGIACTYECPTYHFEWREWAECPDKYKPKKDNESICERKDYPDVARGYTDKSADVVYEKSEDPTKCHRPSDKTLEDTYGMSKDAKDDFKKDHKEWVDSVEICPQCEIASWSCNECQAKPTDDICYEDFTSYCGEEYGCGWVENCPITDDRALLVACTREWVCEDTCEVEPTPTPTPTQVTESKPSGCTGDCSATAPTCPDGNTIQLPANIHVIRNGSSAIVNFFITEGTSANIYYRVLGEKDWQFSVMDVKPNADNFVSVTINELVPALGYEFGVQQKIGCGGGLLATAVVVDDPAPRLFRVNYWTW